ncbi:hypothetical protein LKO27_00490 [Tessaracoccus sp. OS52]|uniref:hypothetical protein n=1 Tax=Tessaracoccus sp. OS52 TaxID=2886691 RepID=UPI001D108908|nr:hypothetical protein [Tessaracoccus sp. OS52]MCC2591909.1 hypothetical protein [Tessaracoccus sp. OS52]
MLPERFTVGLTPLPTAQRVVRQRGALRLRIISAVVSLAILAALVFFFNPGWSLGWVIALFVIWGVSTAVWMTISAVGLHRAKRDLAAIGHGDALYIDAQGIEFVHPRPVRARWSEITGLKITGPSFGAGPNLVMETDGKPVAKIPMSFLDAMPAAIDSAASARSLGRVHVDVSEMDRML